MKITKEAKKIIDELLSTGKNNCIKISEQESCCGTSLYFTLANASEDKLKEIDGVNVLFDDALLERIENVTLDGENGELKIIDEGNGGCC